MPAVDAEAGRLRVAVVAGDPLARAGLAAMLEVLDLTVTARIAPADWSAEPDAATADVVLWDLGWEAGVERLADVEVATDEAAAPPIVLLAERIPYRSAWRAGAAGVLGRDAPPARIAAALRAAAAGLVVAEAQEAEPRASEGAADADVPVEPLTPRETEVLQALAEGLTNRAIGQRLGISEHTVKFHLTAILGKLGAQSRTEAVARGTRLGLILL